MLKIRLIDEQLIIIKVLSIKMMDAYSLHTNIKQTSGFDSTSIS